MIAILASVAARLKGWGVAVLAVLAAVGGAFVIGRSKGKQNAQEAAEAEKANRNAAAAQNALEAAKGRNDVEIDVGRLRDGDAADRLFDGWSRD